MLRLGLDVGTSSLGWTLIHETGTGDYNGFIDSGVLIFPTGRVAKTNAPNAQERRAKRGMRRNLDRVKKRQRRLLNELIRLDLLPREKEQRTPYFALCPFGLRAKALHAPLSKYELGRMLWSFYKRRGFLSNRKMGNASEDTKFKKEIQELQKRIDRSKSQTVGEYFATRIARGKPIKSNGRNKGLRFDRAMIMFELNLIKQKQSPHHGLSEEDWNILLETILFQRALLPVERGICPLTGDERCYKADPYFQHFRMAQEINNLKYSYDGQAMKHLEEKEVWTLFEKLKRTKEVKFKSLAKLFKWPYANIRFNLETKTRQGLQGDETAGIMANKTKGIGEKWHHFSLEEQHEIISLILESDDEEKLYDILETKRHSLNLSSEDVAALIRQGYTLKDGTASYSLSAIKLLLPILRGKQRISVYDAITKAGFEDETRLSPERAKYLPYYGCVLSQHVMGASSLKVTGNKPYQEILTYGKIPNPTVHIALNQIRKLINELIDKYGDLNSISIELARDLKKTEKQKKAEQTRQSENQKVNKEIQNDLENVGVKATGFTKEKMRLWKEQMTAGKAICPYTGRVLSLADVLSEQTEIEHILPFSRTLDDSRANKILCFSSDENKFKGNKSPAEAWQGEKYNQILERAKNLPSQKYWRFLEDAMDKFDQENGFLTRQLNDTRYLSKLCKEYLSVIVPPNKIDVLTGQMTALLRGKWGLNTLLSDNPQKNRNDHRHHLIDAAVIAVTSRSMLQRIARASGKSTHLRNRLIEEMPLPWDSFRPDLKHQVDQTIVSHKAKQKKIQPGQTVGALHNEEAYGVISGPDAKGYCELVETAKEVSSQIIPRIRDPYLREELTLLWDDIQQKSLTDKEKENLLKDLAWTKFKLRKPRLHLRLNKSSLAFIFDKNGSEDTPYKAYKTDGNAYMDVWVLPTKKVVAETINRFSAHQQIRKNHSNESKYRVDLIKDIYPTACKLMRLYTGDMIAVGEKGKSEIYRITTISGSRIEAVHHNESGNIKKRSAKKNKENADYYLPLSKSVGRFIPDKVRKIYVSPTGQVKDAGPFDERRKWKDKL